MFYGNRSDFSECLGNPGKRDLKEFHRGATAGLRLRRSLFRKSVTTHPRFLPEKVTFSVKSVI